MGYMAEKNKVEKSMRKLKIRVLAIVLALLVFLCAFSLVFPIDTWKYYFCLPTTGTRGKGEMRLHFVDVGQGDAIVIELPDGKNVLVDGGNTEEENTTALMRYLQALGISQIDYLLLTHSDNDHCGGLATVLQHKTVKHVFLPMTSDENAPVAYHDFQKALVKENCTVSYFSREIEDTVQSSDENYPYKFTFVYPSRFDVENGVIPSDANLSSAVFWLDYMGTSALFTGDAPASVETKLKDMVDFGIAPVGVDLQSTEILKVSHHGSADATSLEFLRFLHVQTAVVSCGENNLHGHPSVQVCQALSEANATTYRTDVQGSVIVTAKSDGTYSVKTLGK